MFSALATLTPFSDFNQSPRNMYQCQVRGRVPMCDELERKRTYAAHVYNYYDKMTGKSGCVNAQSLIQEYNIE